MVRRVFLVFVLVSVFCVSTILCEAVVSGASTTDEDVDSNPDSNSGACANVTFTNPKVTFVLYNRNYPNGKGVAADSSDEELRSYFIEDIDVKFITHGWLESANMCSVDNIRSAYGSSSDYNVVTVDWSPISRFEYAITTVRLRQVGVAVGNLVIRLIQVKVIPVARVHLIGHSLGAHVVGIAGFRIWYCGFGKVGRATGLDPAMPLYVERPEEMKLDRKNAVFVDAIHTNPGVLGYEFPLGHVDFYPNAGSNIQPGCPALNPFCSHKRSVDFFTESIIHKNAFPAVRCDSYESIQETMCQNGQNVLMGDPTPTRTRGVFYLVTDFIGDCSKSALLINP